MISEPWNEDVARIIARIIGQSCSRQEVGRMNSLSLGFGDEVQRAIKLNDKLYRTWELGTYRSAWRVLKGGNVLCGSQDVADSLQDLNASFQKVFLGRLSSLRQIGGMDLRLEFDTEICVDFLATMSDEDESFHIFGPDALCVEFSVQGGWKIVGTDGR